MVVAVGNVGGFQDLLARDDRRNFRLPYSPHWVCLDGFSGHDIFSLIFFLLIVNVNAYGKSQYNLPWLSGSCLWAAFVCLECHGPPARGISARRHHVFI